MAKEASSSINAATHAENPVWNPDSRRHRRNDFPNESYLVSAVEPESLLREDFRRSCFQRARAALISWPGRAIRHHQSQRKTERCLARASRGSHREVQEGSRTVTSVSPGAPDAVAAPFHPCS